MKDYSQELSEIVKKNPDSTQEDISTFLLAKIDYLRHDLRQCNDTLRAVRRDKAKAQRRYDDLLTIHNEVLASVRALCDETEMDGEGELMAALRQYVWDESDDEQVREMEER